MRTRGIPSALFSFALFTLYDTARCRSTSSPPPDGGAQTTRGPVADLNSACEFKTINYITHTLPQQCHKSAWPTIPSTSASDVPATDATSTTIPEEPAKPSPTEDDSHDMTSTTFMSFEEWKEMMMKKQAQEPVDVRNRKQHEHHAESYGYNSEMDTVGDDSEIDLNFDVLADKITEYTGHGTSREKAGDEQKEAVIRDDSNAAPIVRSKDAGKTCKERFSYASFDAGATVLKTSPGAKNAKAILVETKDTYMLLECSKQNKFVIVELSDDILVDTVVLANFEFFSSMIRHFRVSVSDRYPVKVDKWKVLGTYEARNSRDIQAFLIENPAIWAKYLRIEFLTHYGNEYYCPLSLLRVHGTRMLETWKETESSDDDDVTEEIEAPPVQTTKEPPPKPEPIINDTCPRNIGGGSPIAIFYRAESRNMCPAASPTVENDKKPAAVAEDSAAHAPASRDIQPQGASENPIGDNPTDRDEVSNVDPTSPIMPSPSSSVDSPPSQGVETESLQASQAGSSSSSSSSSSTSLSSSSSSSSSSSAPPPREPASTPAKGKPNQQAQPNGNANGAPTAAGKNKTSTATGSGAPASPTVQESFFKTVSKRLNQLESNTNMSMQYIESQSRFLQQTLKNLEHKQLAKVDAFLDELNTTVLSELQLLKQQYDQVWQSTVIALESQREQSARESVALSQRIQLLADEVVFQKRMAIAQAAVAVVALGLVVFRGGAAVGGNAVGAFLENQRANWMPLSMGSVPHSALPRSPITGPLSAGLDYGSEASTPMKQPVYAKVYQSAGGRTIAHAHESPVGAGDGKPAYPQTPITGSEEDEVGDDSPLTPPTVRAGGGQSNESNERARGTSGSNTSEYSAFAGSTKSDPLRLPAYDEAVRDDESDSFGEPGRTARETSISTEESSLVPSVFEHAGTEMSLDSQPSPADDAREGAGPGRPHVPSGTGMKPMPSLPEDPVSFSSDFSSRYPSDDMI